MELIVLLFLCRVFILLTFLGRKSLAGGAPRCSVLDSVLGTLTRLLSPLSTHEAGFLRAEMDLSLIGWILLFLSVCLDASGTCGGSEDVADKSKDRDQGRVTFIVAFHGLTTTGWQ
jgi:baculoviral IAP repeat-containing protein 6